MRGAAIYRWQRSQAIRAILRFRVGVLCARAAATIALLILGNGIRIPLAHTVGYW